MSTYLSIGFRYVYYLATVCKDLWVAHGFVEGCEYRWAPETTFPEPETHNPGIPGGSWVVISRVISPLI